MTESNRSASSKLVRDVVALGKKYSKSWLSESRTARVARTAQACARWRIEIGALRWKTSRLSHIVSCSPCFQEYAQLPPHVARCPRDSDNSGFSGGAAMLFVTARFAWNTRAATRRAFRKSTIDGSRLVAAKQHHPIAPFALRVDLASFSPTRGDAGDDSEKKSASPAEIAQS